MEHWNGGLRILARDCELGVRGKITSLTEPGLSQGCGDGCLVGGHLCTPGNEAAPES